MIIGIGLESYGDPKALKQPTYMTTYDDRDRLGVWFNGIST